MLSDHTLGWADFRGNFQYISTGNVQANERVALIIMNYATRQRLKIYGHAAVHHADDEPDVVAQLTDNRYEAVVERGIVVTVVAFDWNCQQHITPRYTLEELQPQLDSMPHRLAAAEAENTELRRLLAAAT